MQSALARARSGDGEAFRELTEPYRREIQAHCYRILGSVQDAEDTVQETFFAAWRGLDGFRERASVRAWLYRIATNRCLNALRDAGRRPQPRRPTRPQDDVPEPTRRSASAWFEPYPDTLLEDLPDRAPGPEARYETREALGLAFVAGLQRLPPRQRAVLVLRDVLGLRTAEVADLLDSSGVSVNSALQRARTALDGGRPARDRDRAPLPRSPRERELVQRFVDAMEDSDVDRLVALLTDDAWLTMPPEPLEYQGHAAIARFYRTRAWWGGGMLRLVPTRANGQPAFGCYYRDSHRPVAQAFGMGVLTLEDGRISAITHFGDNGLLPLFGLPLTLPDEDRQERAG
ncbi:RNA polymerase subunit sigma-70 [Streptomyces sp. NPDC006393]|uniref:RNA polymerase subunit sigma-70 n=1 Tax=Streptomyces sp. NPDC006393 TaxID=3156763 RepID=UPI0034031EA8